MVSVLVVVPVGVVVPTLDAVVLSADNVEVSVLVVVIDAVVVSILGTIVDLVSIVTVSGLVVVMVDVDVASGFAEVAVGALVV